MASLIELNDNSGIVSGGLWIPMDAFWKSLVVSGYFWRNLQDFGGI